ncbi:MAG: nicotinate phosphoribosyltransferase [Thermobacillus sp. ZCTH02-B1]|uniref:nicotinate phosphoribosyltransferase n=1 Tax=Thermobacillus sp. ZCTH02-B1 TaxID=1858795 RepID=UPI000B551AA0|nr:nicotinate phosphoribosyltransferase [Thermobacillus sp. ZCTH02-B1]OUM95983.1 MAG: nicotinate phosphoribosyltransferase [Thermobacillus sp. ZCTH02-B1]
MERELYRDDSAALHTDRYQLSMGEVYWADNVHNRRAVFEVYFRKMPFGNGYAIFAGLERVVRYLQNFRFSDTDLAYLREQGFDGDYLDFLRDLRFTGTLRSMREGEVVFANEPIMRIEAPLIQCQLIETAILNIVNYQTLIATKASRIKQIIGDDDALEFGSRRAHEMDAAVWGARAAYIGGFAGTSNVRAGKMFGIPIVGTHAHAMVQAYGDEYTAFKKYASRHRHCVFLVDTYDTLRSGVPNAIRVAREFGDRIHFVGIRLDSGDLAYLSKKAREMLDKAGFPDAKIVASSDLDEHTILNLKAQGARIDVWGIGTRLITAYDQPALGVVYKMAAIEDENGTLQDTIKISSNPEKISTPGLKRVWRIVNRRTGKAEGDYIALEHEDPRREERLKMFHPVHTHLMKYVTNFEARELHHTVFEDGRLVCELPKLEDIRRFARDNLDLLWDEYKRTMNPPEYPVDLSQACWDNRMAIIRRIREAIEAKAEEI